MEQINLKKIFEEDEYVKRANIKFDSIHGDNMVLKMRPERNQLNTYGILHGAEIFALMDTAAGLLSISKGRKAVTLDSSINFIKSIGEGEEIYSNTRIVHMGKKTEVVEVEAKSKDKIIARASFTFFIVNEIEVLGLEFLEK